MLCTTYLIRLLRFGLVRYARKPENPRILSRLGRADRKADTDAWYSVWPSRCVSYLPGAKSPAFQEFPFLGVLLSLGPPRRWPMRSPGSSDYMRSYLVGDWVQIGETTGEVMKESVGDPRPYESGITIPNARSEWFYSVEPKNG